MFTAFALAVVVAAGVTQGPVHAADPGASPPASNPAATQTAGTTPPENTAIWNPGQVTYQVDNSGCHTTQNASIETATPAIADTVSATLVADSIKVTSLHKDPDLKLVQISGVQKNDTHIDVIIDGWLSNTACAKATSDSATSDFATSDSAQQASVATGPGAGSAATTTRVLGTVDLADRDQIALASVASWFKLALKVVAVAAVFVAIAAITVGVVGGLVAEGGAVIALEAQAALTGCIAVAAAELIAARILIPEAVPTYKERLSHAVTACIAGGIAFRTFGLGLAAGVRRRLNTTPAILGDSTVAVANQLGVDVTGLASLVDGVAEGGLRASQ